MHDVRRFRQQLAARIVGALGVAALASPGASCGAIVTEMASSGSSSSRGATSGPAPPGTGGAGAMGTGGHGAVSAGGHVGNGGAGGVTGDGGVEDAAADAGTGGAIGTGGALATGGASGAGDAGGAGGQPANPPKEVCFAWPLDAGACPVDSAEAIAVFESLGCPLGWEPNQILSGPVSEPPDLCCYVTEITQCGPGGRPYLVDRGARLAAPARGAGTNGWSHGDAPCLEGLTSDERASLARAWTVAALFEHASVASFSRASLELLAAGAPGDLVELAHRAALDEIRHARLCFALAAAYAGADLAPGPFPLGGGVPLRASLAEIAAGTVEEGCVGETLAAVVAAEQLARATDPAVRAALAQIAADEARHAELAWRTVAWAVRVGGTDVRAAVERALRAAVAGEREIDDDAPASASRLEAHGQLDAAARARIVANAMADVVAPCARILLEREATLGHHAPA